jgi:hypothetical protein
MGLDEEDSLAVIAVVPRDELGDEPESASPESVSPSQVSEMDPASPKTDSSPDENGS